MILHAADKEAPLYKVIDLSTNSEIKNCLFANDETGEYEVYVSDEKGNPKYSERGYLTEKRKGNIKLIKKEEIK